MEKSPETVSEFIHSGITYVIEPPVEIPRNFTANTVGEIMSCIIRQTCVRYNGNNNHASDVYAKTMADVTDRRLTEIDKGESQLTVLDLMHSVLRYSRKYRVSIKDNPRNS